MAINQNKKTYIVFQGGHYKEEYACGYLFAPYLADSGMSIHHWGRLTELKPGDKVFHYSGSTFYINTRLFASPQAGRRDQLIQALKGAGFGDIVTETVNANTLASFVKEQMALNGDVIPGWLDAVVNTHEKVSVGIRKG